MGTQVYSGVSVCTCVCVCHKGMMGTQVYSGVRACVCVHVCARADDKVWVSMSGLPKSLGTSVFSGKLCRQYPGIIGNNWQV